jgi:hypothetical protein
MGFATPPVRRQRMSGKAAGGMSALVGRSWGWSGILGLLHPPVRRPTIALRQHSCYLPPVWRPEIAADWG